MKIALIYNFAQHYRTNIFMLMDRELDIDFYFGDHYLNVKKMDYSLLKHQVKEVKNMKFGPLVWQTNTVKLAWANYDTYIMLGEPMCISSWLVLIFSRILGKRFYFWTHGWYGREGWLKRIIKKAYFGLANGTMLYGEYARNIMLSQGFSAKRLAVIHNSLAYDTQIALRDELKESFIYRDHFGNNYPNIVFVGRLTEVKKLDQILLSQSICKSDGCVFNVTFIGEGEMGPRLQHLAKILNLEKFIWFYGSTYDEKELSQLLYNADLCVAPGNIGLTAMHAMTFGCPCISHNDFRWQMPEFEAIQEGVTGAFFERDNTEDLARVIKEWLYKHKGDRERIRDACFKEIDEKWNPHRQIEVIKEMVGL